MTGTNPYNFCIVVTLVLVASPAAYGTGINWNVFNTCGRTFGYAMSVTHSAMAQNVNPWQWVAGTLMAYLGNNGSHFTFCNSDDDLHDKPSCRRTGHVFSWGLGLLAVAAVVHATFSYKLDEQKKAERQEELTAKKQEQAVKYAYFSYILEKQKKKEEAAVQAVGVELIANQPQILPAIQQIQEIRSQMEEQNQEIRIQMEEQKQEIRTVMEKIMAEIIGLRQQQPAGAVANHNQIA